jgi:hypothetical protein
VSDEVDRILDILDVGLQTSAEHGYGTDDRNGLCARCQRNDPMPEGDLCAGCRAFLLGDSDDDPAQRRANRSAFPIWPRAMSAAMSAEAFGASLRRASEMMGPAATAIGRAVLDEALRRHVEPPVVVIRRAYVRRIPDGAVMHDREIVSATHHVVKAGDIGWRWQVLVTVRDHTNGSITEHRMNRGWCRDWSDANKAAIAAERAFTDDP